MEQRLTICTKLGEKADRPNNVLKTMCFTMLSDFGDIIFTEGLAESMRFTMFRAQAGQKYRKLQHAVPAGEKARKLEKCPAEALSESPPPARKMISQSIVFFRTGACWTRTNAGKVAKKCNASKVYFYDVQASTFSTLGSELCKTIAIYSISCISCAFGSRLP